MKIYRNFSILVVILNIFIFFVILIKPHYFFLLPLFILLNIFFLLATLNYWHKKNNYYKQLHNLTNSNNIIYSDLILSKPYNYETKIIYDTITTTNKIYRTHLAKYEKKEAEYRDFIELWIHDLKSPMTALYLLDNSPTQLEELAKIEQKLNFILYYARSSFVQNDYHIQAISLEKLIQSCIQNYSTIFIQKKITPIFFEQDTTVFTDFKWMKFVISQIIDNALKYSTPNSKIKFYYEKNKHSIRLYIQDYGIGILPHELPRVFEKGFTHNNTTFEKSTGFGLYLVKKICDSLNTPISITSQNGTTVMIDFLYENSFVA